MGWALHVLGSGQDGGLPQFGARRGLDDAARRGMIPARTAASIAFVHHDGRTLLVDASPDLRHQEALLVSAGAGRHGAPVDGVVITHAHIGHYAGLVHFGEESLAATDVPLWGTPEMLGFLTANQPWGRLLTGGHLRPMPIPPGRSVSVFPDLEMTLIPVPHRREDSDAVAVSAGGALYLPDIDSWEEWPEAESVITRHPVCLLDGTFFESGELSHRDQSAVRHPPVSDTISRFAHLASDRRMVLTHLNHTNPLGDPDSTEHGRTLAVGFEVAWDGMKIELAV